VPGYTKRWARIAARAKAYYQEHPELEVKCWICRRPIGMWLHHNHPLAFTMDHIVPRILGGEDTLGNAMPAHRSCNSRRARELDYAMSNVHNEKRVILIRNTRNWSTGDQGRS
jgi:5-methylcytosine-specific restriction endonuclease McrA